MPQRSHRHSTSPSHSFHEPNISYSERNGNVSYSERSGAVSKRLLMLVDEDDVESLESLLYECISIIQQQYSAYSYEFKKNYKSWSNGVNNEMMTNKEYLLMWEWFRETLMGAQKEDGVVVKTLVNYCINEGVFESYRETFRFFDSMGLSHENLVQSFTELISVVTNSSIEEGVQLRQHVKNRSKVGKKKNTNENCTRTDDCTTRTDETCSLRSHRSHRSSNPGSTENLTSAKKADVKKSWRPRRNSALTSLPALSPKDKSPNSSRNNSKDINSCPSFPRIDSPPTPTLAPISKRTSGRLHSIGRVIRRQLSRMSSQDGGANDKSQEDQKEISGGKDKKDKKKMQLLAQSSPAPVKARKPSVISALGKNIRMQLKRMTSLADE